MARAKAEPKVNYTDSQVETVKSMYAELGNDGLDEIAQAVGKSVKSVRAKLVREGVYVKPEAPVKGPKDEGPSKKEILIAIEQAGFNPEGLAGATKDALTRLLAAVQTPQG